MSKWSTLALESNGIKKHIDIAILAEFSFVQSQFATSDLTQLVGLSIADHNRSLLGGCIMIPNPLQNDH